MRDEPLRFFFSQFLFKPGDIPVILRRIAIFPSEQRTKRTQAFKTDTVTNIGNADTFLRQHFFSRIQSYLRKILMRCFFVHSCKQPVKMKPG